MEIDQRLSKELARLDLVRVNLAKDHERLAALSQPGLVPRRHDGHLTAIVQRLEAASGMVSHSTDALVRHLVTEDREPAGDPDP